MHLATFIGAVSYHMASGDAGIEQTIGMARGLVDQGIKTPIVNETAIKALNEGGAEQFSDMAAARAIYEWVQRNIRYVPDPVNKETVRWADVILHVKAGDCDDINGVLIPSLLGTIGIKSQLVTVAADAGMPEQFSHVYCEALIDGAWVPMDAARVGARFGLAPETVYRRHVWDLYQGGGPVVGQLNGAGLSFDWGTLVNAIPNIEQGVAQIVSAGKGYPTYPGIITTGAGYPGQPGTYAGAQLGTNISPLLLVGGLALLAFIVMRK